MCANRILLTCSVTVMTFQAPGKVEFCSAGPGAERRYGAGSGAAARRAAQSRTSPSPRAPAGGPQPPPPPGVFRCSCSGRGSSRCARPPHPAEHRIGLSAPHHRRDEPDAFTARSAQGGLANVRRRHAFAAGMPSRSQRPRGRVLAGAHRASRRRSRGVAAARGVARGGAPARCSCARTGSSRRGAPCRLALTNGTDRQTDGRTERQTGRQAGRQTDARARAHTHTHHHQRAQT